MRSVCRGGKMWWSKTAQRAFKGKAHARLRFCGTRPTDQREGGREQLPIVEVAEKLYLLSLYLLKVIILIWFILYYHFYRFSL
jgi:hypothetical protein